MTTKDFVRPLPDIQGKYQNYLKMFKVDLPDRQWPTRTLTKSPIWCSVDLRDGNQALINPMSVVQKLEMFDLLLAIGFKQIEIGFPSASQIEFDFCRQLIDEKRIPEDVWPQVLMQSRIELIDRTFEAVKDARQVIMHLYNSTSRLQREVVFGKSREDIKELALLGTRHIRKWADSTKTKVQFEYSPESFTGTELDYSLDVCMAVAREWRASPEQKIIFNLPATVEHHTPNVHADQIEWFIRSLGKLRDSVVISLHTHNDRGTGIAATELGLLAGADRVEGTLFGNGERTGNVDLVTVALNLYTQGIKPGLNLGNIPQIRKVCERLTEIPVNQRHPYAGELVFTAFSGSHQDAIRKGLRARREKQQTSWDVPYIPVDPNDIGREYEPVVRINSQSGKGGVAFILEEYSGFSLPKKMHPEFSRIIQKVSEVTGKEVLPDAICQAFSNEYLLWSEEKSLVLKDFESAKSGSAGSINCKLKLVDRGQVVEIKGVGNGPIDAAHKALSQYLGKDFKLDDYAEHSLGSGSDAEAAAYVSIRNEANEMFYGVGKNPNTVVASINALLSAINRAFL